MSCLPLRVCLWDALRRWRWLFHAIAYYALALLAGPSLAPAAGPTGQEIYRTLCADCHGAFGEGVQDRYDDPLHGDRSLDDLTKIIDETMPDETPEKCTGENARKVAEFIYETFYTEEARARNKPPRIELARLTVRQYASVAADLMGSFTGEAPRDEQRGLKAQYFNSKGFRGDKRVLERIDPQVAFDFGTGSPAPDKIAAEEFAVQWQGGLIAEETGDYEFCLSTENAARMWVNDADKPLIDAWVKSGDDTEHRRSLRLLGGRVYPIRVELSKAKDQSASISLQWQPPHRALEVIPRRNLSPHGCPPVLVVTTEFPPDDSSVGYERGTSVSKAWDQATTYAAIEIANRVAERLTDLAQCPDDAPDRARRVKEFCYRFAERAFRRPLTDGQKRFFVDAQLDPADDLDKSVKRVVLLVLKSPRFLYPGIGVGGPDDYDVASRLSFGLWDSLPDEELRQAAAQGQLRTPEQVAAQARRMLANDRTKSKLRYFLHNWLQVERAYDISKSKDLFPGFDRTLASDALTSLDLLLEDVLWNGSSDLRQLLLTEELFVNRRLAEFYGLPVPAEDGFHKVVGDPQRQVGILTHPYLMMGFAYHTSSSPIHRGVFLVRSVLGRSLKPPPMAVAPLDEGLDPKLTTRERVALQTQPAACQTCHSLINPLGFSLEHFDAVGRFRTQEKEQPIDAAGGYVTVAGEEVRFVGARELAEFLARSEDVPRSFVEQLFQHLVKQPIQAYGPDRLRSLEAAFAESGFDVQELIVEMMRICALVDV